MDADAGSLPFGLWLRQSGASELYVDGRLANAYGTVGADYDTERVSFRTHSDWGARTLSLSLSPGSHVLAVRYSNFTAARRRHLEPVGFLLYVGDLARMADEAGRRAPAMAATQFGFTVACLTFAILQLALFVFYPRVRQNLYFACTTAGWAALTFLDYQQHLVHDLGTNLVLFGALRGAILEMSGFMLLFTYSIFRQRPPRYFWGYAAVCGLTVVPSAV